MCLGDCGDGLYTGDRGGMKGGGKESWAEGCPRGGGNEQVERGLLWGRRVQMPVGISFPSNQPIAVDYTPAYAGKEAP